MRIGIVCPYSLTPPGGVQGQVLGLARALRAAGHEARVLAPCDGPPPEPFVTPLGNSIPTASNGSMAPLAPDLPASLRTIRALRDEEFDVVHVHEPMAPGPTATAMVMSDPSPIVATFHRAGGSPLYTALRPLVRWAADHIAVRCAVSEDARATAVEALGGTYEVLFNGIEIERFTSVPPWPSEAPAIFFVGRHEPRKGLSVLIDAMAEIPGDVRLWVAGQGEETARLRARTKDDERIEWLGTISDTEKAARLRGATVFCAPSLHGESFGVVLLEAMAASTPIVASDLQGYRNVARNSVDALLVPPGDAAALGAAVRDVLADPVLAKELVTAGEARASTFSMARLADRYVDIYSRLT